jgi:hypothetical protein
LGGYKAAKVGLSGAIEVKSFPELVKGGRGLIKLLQFDKRSNKLDKFAD